MKLTGSKECLNLNDVRVVQLVLHWQVVLHRAPLLSLVYQNAALSMLLRNLNNVNILFKSTDQATAYTSSLKTHSIDWRLHSDFTGTVIGCAV